MLRCPVDYGLCDRKVTVYHREGDEISRTVYDRAFFDTRRSRSLEREGERGGTSFLLVIPGELQAVEVGDKVIAGEGPVVEGREAWRRFVPALVPGLAVVSHVDVKHWQGRIVHTEAAGKLLRVSNLAQMR